MSSSTQSTKNRILQTTLALLEANAGKGVRMTDIARGAGISRQAVYLHFATRTELLVAATQHLDQLKGIDQRLASSRAASTGVARLQAFVEAWGNYIPEIYGVAKAMMAMKETDDDAAEAWTSRMQDVREGCAAAIHALHHDGRLAPEYTPKEAIDVLWALLSVRFWEQLTQDCHWTQAQYLGHLQLLVSTLLVVKVPC